MERDDGALAARSRGVQRRSADVAVIGILKGALTRFPLQAS